MSRSKLALITVLAAVSIASRAFAQSQDHFGGVLPHYFDGSGALIWGSWTPAQAPEVVHHRIARVPASARHPDR